MMLRSRSYRRPFAGVAAGWRATRRSWRRTAAPRNQGAPRLASDFAAGDHLAAGCLELCLCRPSRRWKLSQGRGDPAAEVEAVLTRVKGPLTSSGLPDREPTAARPSGTRSWTGLGDQDVRVLAHQRDRGGNRVEPAEIHVGLVDHDGRIRAGRRPGLDLGQRQQAAGGGVGVGKITARSSPRRDSRRRGS